uniref:Uncharacterized protein n=1 Tax=Plectus sambesii TaxID=2011161 RepID=A0A914WGV1_9BILA
MHLRLVAVSLAMMVCAFEVSEATFVCMFTERDIYDCLYKPKQKKTLKEFEGQLKIYNMPKVTSILEKLKTKGCIEASVWPDVETWIKVNTPPAPYLTIYNKLSKAQKNTIVQYTSDWDNKQLQKKAEAVYKVIEEKRNKLSVADKKIVEDWEEEYNDACLN